ncbi:DUF1284 domain-containing protein [Rhizobium alvei]|uniref:DUF1284 domain-containing protein n=1 Tax=Rhizobium alvei TaxID=1132659 RepID=A0ABT8YGF6_9HYPH|nr:DUF1284 domain-containing protein [Rhizobium alvei]MDO6962761.1 DUF1284 domain-containing protein [Rhizobium alvei]
MCILTYRGYGYTPAFVANMSEIVAAISNGRPVELSEGPDDICNGFTEACRAISDHDCSLESTRTMDRVALLSVLELLPELALNEPVTLDAVRIAALRAAFADGSLRAACADCSWRDFCTEIAADGFSGVRLSPAR